MLRSAQSSADQRQDKKWLVTVQPFGYGPNAFSSNGVNAGLFIDPESIVQLEVTISNRATPFFSWNKNENDYKINAYSFGAHYKQFVGSSFYFNAGLDYRKVDYRYEPSSGNMLAFKGDSSGLSLSIGNQWVFNRFTIGCDWVGFFTPFYSGTSDENYTGSKSDLDSDIRTYVEKSQIMLTRVYLGFAF